MRPFGSLPFSGSLAFQYRSSGGGGVNAGFSAACRARRANLADDRHYRRPYGRFAAARSDCARLHGSSTAFQQVGSAALAGAARRRPGATMAGKLPDRKDLATCSPSDATGLARTRRTCDIAHEPFGPALLYATMCVTIKPSERMRACSPSAATSQARRAISTWRRTPCPSTPTRSSSSRATRAAAVRRPSTRKTSRPLPPMRPSMASSASWRTRLTR